MRIQIKSRLKYWYLFSITKKIVDKIVSIVSAAITFIVYIPILIIVIIWLLLAGKRGKRS